MLKLIYIAKRKPGYSFDEFVCRWRKHGALGMEQPFWRHAIAYVQAEPIRPSPIDGATGEYDAVACFMICEELFSAMTEDDAAGAAKMAADELETFAVPIPTVSLWVTEELIQPGELGGITAFLFFEEAAPARKAALQAPAAGGLHRITLNLRDDESLGPAVNTLPYAAVVELAATDIPTLSRAVAPDNGNLLATADLAVVTRETVLWDRLVGFR